METIFFEKSKEIADNYLQSIVFLDDKAFENNIVTTQENNQHAFDSSKISKVFAQKKKICAVYKPLIESDIDNFKEISKKADVVIIDWLITLQNSDDANTNLMDDEEIDDPRGQYTKKVIKELIEFSGSDSLKLVLIYTGEDILDEITLNIFKDISQWNQTFKLNENNCEVYSTNIRVLVRGKYSEDNELRFRQRPHLLSKTLTYEELPAFILNEFTLMTSGLLSNFALFSLTQIRNNSHKILSLFSKELDPAYLSHKSLLPHGDDAEQILYHLLKDSIGDLLFYCNTGKVLSQELINDWIDCFIKNENIPARNKKGNQFNPNIDFKRDKQLLNSILFSGETNVEKKFASLFKKMIPKEQQEPFLSYLSNSSTILFLNREEFEREDFCNKQFAKLTHHKSLFLPSNTPPVLTLGSIIKSSDKDDYYICIQQKCDSLRIKRNDIRKFLFLPLSKVDNDRFDLVTHDGVKLKLEKKSFALKTMKFKCDTDKGVILGRRNDTGKYIFKDIYDEEFEWILDLKDLHSQRIVTEYASELSRIGLDESEWLRRASNNKNELL